MATIKERIEPYAGEIDSWHSLDLNSKADQFAVDAHSNLVGIIAAQQPEMLHLFSADYQSDTSGNTNGWTSYVYTLAETEKVVNVFLEDYVCIEVPSILERQVKEPASNYMATVTSPVFLRKTGKIHVHPAGGSKKVTMRIIDFDTNIDISDDTTVFGVPEEFLILISLHVAKFLINYKLVLLQDLLPTLESVDSNAGFLKLKEYIEDEEDTEIAQVKLQSLQLESAQLQVEYQWLQQQFQLVNQEYMTQSQIIIGVEARGYSPAAAQESHGQGGG
jgi:hypothetical protein